MKTCTKCGGTGPFYKDKRSSDGLRSQCRDCINNKCKTYRDSPSRQEVQQGKGWREMKRRQWRDWYWRDPEYCRKLFRKYAAKRDVFMRYMGSRISTALKEAKNRQHWEALVGYTLDQLKAHLESKFQPGMTWDNYGRYGWHVDHIRPQSSFSFSSPTDPEFLQCWGLANLQPLWAEDNLRKSDKWEPKTENPS